MGGENAPRAVVEGAKIACGRDPSLSFTLFGNAEAINPLVAEIGLTSQAVVIHCDKVIADDEPASRAVRRGQDSSMGRAIEAVKIGVEESSQGGSQDGTQRGADAAVSSGNTGALMAMALFALRTLPDIDRPAICSYFPSTNGMVSMLDLGANIDCDSRHLSQFAVLGEVFARTVLGREQPTIGLLNVGVEDIKGNDVLKQTAALLESSSLMIDFKGFVEGDDVAKGTVDVVVTDGFTGNVALKMMEGTARLIAQFMRETFQSSWLTKLAYLFARPALRRLRDRMDPRHYNGAVLLGLNGIIVKSHGSTDAVGFANAIKVAADMARNDIFSKIRDEMTKLDRRANGEPED